ncbi:hypothetical protein [Halorubrum sp. CSM-61]|uniref:hypothetical protein n=1 Tax=Halorubrum sp. CSM-61 TaxID=2485838 RepID=UPI000F4BEB23|nr:hypothetical protein [Halorubrum sp. CSM-61]
MAPFIAFSAVGVASAASFSTTIDDFEDGDTNIETDGWSGWDDPDGTLSADSTDPIDGDVSGEISVTNGLSGPSTTSSSTHSPSRVAFDFRLDTLSSGDSLRIMARSTSQSNLFDIDVRGRDLYVRDGTGFTDTGMDLKADEKYIIEFRNIDWSTDTFDLYVDGNRLANGASFQNSASAFDKIQMQMDTRTSGETGTATFDDVGYGGSETVTYEEGPTEDFEDGTIQVNESGWNPDWSGDTGNLSLSDSNSISGSHSASLSSNDGSSNVYASTDYQSNVTSVSFDFRATNQTGAELDEGQVQLQTNAGEEVVQVEFEDSGIVKGFDGTATDTGHTWSEQTTYNVEFVIDWTSETHDIYLNGEQIANDWAFKSSASGFSRFVVASDTASSGNSREVLVDNIEAGTLDATAAVSGRVVTTDGTGVPDGTVVEAYGVRESNINTSDAQTLEERAAEIRDEMQSFDPEQIGWNPDLALTGGDGKFQNSDAKYVAMHEPGDWALERYTDSPDLSNPILTADEGEDVILSVWDPNENPLVQDGLENGLYGTVDDNTDIQIKQLDYSGSVVNTRTVSTSGTYNTQWPADDHDYARVSLPPGFYRVSAEGSSVSYVVTVGDPEELTQSITNDLQSDANELTDRAQYITDLMSDEKVVELTTTTYTENGESGQFGFSEVPSDVNVVAVQAYSPSAKEYQIDDPANASIQDLREVAALDTYNGSFVVTPRARDLAVPSSDNTVKAVELDSSPFMNPSRFENKSAFLEELFSNSSFADQFDEYLDTSEEERTQIRDRLENIKDQNTRLQDRYQELLERQYNGTEPDTQEQIRLLRQTISELEGACPKNIHYHAARRPLQLKPLPNIN